MPLNKFNKHLGILTDCLHLTRKDSSIPSASHEGEFTSIWECAVGKECPLFGVCLDYRESNNKEVF